MRPAPASHSEIGVSLMQKSVRVLSFLLCLMLALPLACAEEAEQIEKIIPPLRALPDYVEKLLHVAVQEIGYSEDKSGVTKYGIWSGDPAAEWCAEFLCWCVDQVDRQENTGLLNSVYPYYTGTNTGKNWFIRQGRYISRKGRITDWGSQWFRDEETIMEKNSYVPQPGDWVFFSTSATGDTTHVAMVEYCAYDENGKIQVHVIEGNNPSAVARNEYPIDYWATLGYGTVFDLADVTLRFGNEGAKVTALQEMLVEAKLLEEQYTTGKYGAITQQAISDFQKLMEINVTGIADITTQKLLKEYARETYMNDPQNWVVGDE